MSEIVPRSIEGETICLREMSKRNIPRLLKWSRDVELRHLSGESDELDISEAQIYLDSMRPEARRFWYLIINRADGKPIGDCGLIGSLQPMKYTDLSLRIWERRFWGKGHSTEAMRLLLTLAFKGMNLQRVRVEIVSFNERAKTFYKYFGFKRYAKRPIRYAMDGKPYDFVRMSLSRRIYNEKLHRKRTWRNRLGYR